MLRVIPLPNETLADLTPELPDVMTQFILTQWALEYETNPCLRALLLWRLDDLVKSEEWPTC